MKAAHRSVDKEKRSERVQGNSTEPPSSLRTNAKNDGMVILNMSRKQERYLKYADRQIHTMDVPRQDIRTRGHWAGDRGIRWGFFTGVGSRPGARSQMKLSSSQGWTNNWHGKKWLLYVAIFFQPFLFHMFFSSCAETAFLLPMASASTTRLGGILFSDLTKLSTNPNWMYRMYRKIQDVKIQSLVDYLHRTLGHVTVPVPFFCMYPYSGSNHV